MSINQKCFYAFLPERSTQNEADAGVMEILTRSVNKAAALHNTLFPIEVFFSAYNLLVYETKVRAAIKAM